MRILEQAVNLFSLKDYDCRESEDLDYEDIEDAAECLIYDIPFAGIGQK